MYFILLYNTNKLNPQLDIAQLIMFFFLVGGALKK
jgi:hypothetical protein